MIVRQLLVLVAGAAIALTPVALAKPKPAAKGAGITQQDVGSCLGINGSDSNAQIAACTKIINSGIVKAPHLGDYYATRGAAYLATQRVDKALADLNKALTIRPAAEFYVQRGMIYLIKRNFDAAKADLAQVIKLKPDFAPGYLMRGLVSYQADEYEEALTFFDSAVKRVPTYYQALYARGVAKKKTGDESGGEKDMKDARGMRPKVDEEMKKFGLTPG